MRLIYNSEKIICILLYIFDFIVLIQIPGALQKVALKIKLLFLLTLTGYLGVFQHLPVASVIVNNLNNDCAVSAIIVFDSGD